MPLIIRFLLSIAAVGFTSWLLPGVHLVSFWSAFFLVIVLGILNFLVRPILIILTIPITILTLGLFLLVINAIIIMLADHLISGFTAENFWWALLFSVILSGVNSIIASITESD